MITDRLDMSPQFVLARYRTMTKKKQQAKISSNSRFTPSNFHIVSVRKDDDDDLGRGREKRNETLKRKQEIERRRGIFSGFHH